MRPATVPVLSEVDSGLPERLMLLLASPGPALRLSCWTGRPPPLFPEFDGFAKGL